MNRRLLLLAAFAFPGLLPGKARAANSEFRRLGRRLASLREPRDVFRFRAPLAMLDVRIRNSGLWIDHVVFEFADGTSHATAIKRRIPKGGVAAAMSFDAGRSPLRQVVIGHANLPLGRERPVIELWGRPAYTAA